MAVRLIFVLRRAQIARQQCNIHYSTPNRQSHLFIVSHPPPQLTHLPLDVQVSLVPSWGLPSQDIPQITKPRITREYCVDIFRVIYGYLVQKQIIIEGKAADNKFQSTKRYPRIIKTANSKPADNEGRMQFELNRIAELKNAFIFKGEVVPFRNKSPNKSPELKLECKIVSLSIFV